MVAKFPFQRGIPYAVSKVTYYILSVFVVLAAVSDAQQKAQKTAQEQMGKLTGGLQLPFKLPF